MATITDLVEQWRKVRAQRLELDNLSKQLKTGLEAQLRGQILMWLDSNELESARTEHGTASVTAKTHLEITDTEKFLKHMYDKMTQCLQEGRPLVDGLMLQQTPLKSYIQDYVGEKETDEEFNKVSETFGIRRVSDRDISFKSSK